MGAPSQTKGPVVTFISNELERKLITQNDKDSTVDSNCTLGMRNPTESPGSVGNDKKAKCQVSVEKNVCHRDSEDLSSKIFNEVCFQMDFPLNTAESNSAVPATDELFLIEKMLPRDADQYGNQDEKTLGPTSSPQEPAEYQQSAPLRPNSEGGENKYDSKGNCYHQIDILLSPQKLKAFKDQNLEINSLRKLSQELAVRDERVSDGSQEDAIDQWARRRQQLKDGKRCSSAGGSSFTSTISEGSTTWFHTTKIQRTPDHQDHSTGSRHSRPRVREQTVRLFKGTGDYPWGFRIQFSKPIMVTEVDANSAAEEAGLQIGDVVLSVNGTKVTSVAHAEAVHLARKVRRHSVYCKREKREREEKEKERR
ncbi:PDZ and LIM domain protein 2 [Heterocephalus glaber]|uniref:PDZ and LIM domain protein 2 n=1 Tax=Heterocephalus glaber TaxID=10181 RepID=G5B9D3_HETGA|nr:PDZ and LIM domain protein 2 [Heterocephalus glaber]